MLKLEYQRYNLPFKYPFTTAHGPKTHQEGLLINIGFANFSGSGELTQIPYYAHTDVEYLIGLIEEKRPLIETYAMIDPQRFWHFLHHLVPDHHFLISAFDVAGWDLFGQMRRAPLHRLVGMQWRGNKPTCYTIASQNLDEIKTIIQEEQYPIYKMKLTHIDQLSHVQYVKEHTNSAIWIDANEAWSEKEFIQIMPELVRLGVTLVEQPLHRDDWEGMQAVYAQRNEGIQYIADESCQHLPDVARIATCFDGANIKLAKCGGITPALSMMQALKKEQKKIMLGTMSEAMPVACATAQLAPVADFVDVDAPLLLQDKIGSGLNINKEGLYSFSSPIGIGYRM